MRQRDPCELLRRSREHANAHAGGVQASQCAGHLGVAAEVDRRTLFREALEQVTPVRQLLVEGGDVHAKATRGVVEPVAPERLDVTERGEVDSDRLHRSRTCSHASIPSDSPTASIATSTGDAWRPRTKYWWSSSVAAYAMPTAKASASRSSAR